MLVSYDTDDVNIYVSDIMAAGYVVGKEWKCQHWRPDLISDLNQKGVHETAESRSVIQDMQPLLVSINVNERYTLLDSPERNYILLKISGQVLLTVKSPESRCETYVSNNEGKCLASLYRVNIC